MTDKSSVRYADRTPLERVFTSIRWTSNHPSVLLPSCVRQVQQIGPWWVQGISLSRNSG
jgi:hypothetical protein